VIALQQAIFQRWQAGAGAALRGLATGGYHLGLAPQGTALPYLTGINVDAGDTDADSSTDERLDVIRWQFSIYVRDGALGEGYSIRDALVALFDDNKLETDGGLRVHGVYRRNAGRLIREPDEGWQIVVVYEYRMTGL